MGSGRGAVAPSQNGGLGLCTQKIFQKSTLKSRIFRNFCKLKWSLMQWCQSSIRIKILFYISKITSIIGSDEILNRPHVCSQPPTTRKICLLSILSKAEVHLLVLRCLNLYSLKCIISLLNFRPVFLGAPLQLGAPSARLVRLWVNPALFGMKYDFRQWRKFALCF